MSFYDLAPNALDGTPRPLAEFRGKVALVVNTASACGYTPQYAGLERLWQEYQNKGLVVLGFPSNDFGRQEPGTAAEIATFCQKNYGVTFPMFEKVETKGGSISPVYALLESAGNAAPKWNFSKYLVGRDGTVRGFYESKVAPEDGKLREAIDAALAEH